LSIFLGIDKTGASIACVGTRLGDGMQAVKETINALYRNVIWVLETI
jgi:hypothetical protein